MNHTYVPLKTNPIICASCSRNMIAHLPSATCEQCGKVGLCDLLNQVLLCADCKDNAIEGVRTHGVLPGAKVIEYEKSESVIITELMSTPIDDEDNSALLADLPANGSEFYNSKVEAIINLQKGILADDTIPRSEKYYVLAKRLTIRRAHLFKILVQAKEIVTEVEAENSAIHRTINMIAANLKKEEREKLNIKYAEYIPSTPPKKVLNPRKSTEDKVIEGIAKTMFAPRNDKGQVSWEELPASDRDSLITKAKSYYKQMFAKK